MPRKVDHEARRRHIVESLLRITAEQGLEAVSLREVAAAAGVSMGQVQHYFATKDDMLLYALRHWLSLTTHDGFAARVARRAAIGPVGGVLGAIAAEYLPYDEISRDEARIAAAFLSRAAVRPELAAALAPAFAGFADVLRGALDGMGVPDAPAEAGRLAALLDGLRPPVLIGALSYADALAVVDRHLGRL
ncbi:AcrR family transcriptional regulator [Catenuloplanes nepalensis]|uniref:AcrR family transcriptional regulator n=1 Tax=Catenuloplanes nepalensis TaxID=587533 RepID=A0ABT9MT14_9ACTN|nr:TetR family transcriptional regulator C-terminal domain-containing protein [Catenuloplanes nepalensis]MDP9794575.1 AcrR family transcriptional regulator [Catenuloplanes nepalensis]